MRLTLEKALDIYFSLGIDLYSTESITQASAAQVAAICKYLGVSIEKLPEVIKLSIVGYNETKSKKGSKEQFNIIKMLELLGESGLSTYNVTPLELIAYIKGAYKRDWATTSAILACIYNANCSKRAQAKKPSDFNPTIEKKEPPARDLKELFNKQRVSNG